MTIELESDWNFTFIMNIPILSSAFTLYILEYDLYLLLEVQEEVVFSRCGDDHPIGDLEKVF